MVSSFTAFCSSNIHFNMAVHVTSNKYIQEAQVQTHIKRHEGKFLPGQRVEERELSQVRERKTRLRKLVGWHTETEKKWAELVS